MDTLMQTHGGLHPDFDGLVNKENGDYNQCRQSSFGDHWMIRRSHFFC